MSFIRTDEQAALYEAHIAVEESAHHLRDASEFLDDPALSGLLREAAERREGLTRRLEEAVRDSGDLPAEPDPDRESLEQLAHRIGAALSPDDRDPVVRQRIDAEQQLLQRIDEACQVEMRPAYQSLVADIRSDIAALLDELRSRVNDSGAS